MVDNQSTSRLGLEGDEKQKSSVQKGRSGDCVTQRQPGKAVFREELTPSGCWGCITEYNKLDGLEQQKFIVLKFWRLEV